MTKGVGRTSSRRRGNGKNKTGK